MIAASKLRANMTTNMAVSGGKVRTKVNTDTQKRKSLARPSKSHNCSLGSSDSLDLNLLN